MSLQSMEGVADKVKIVVNRMGLDNGQISLKKAQDTMGRDIFWQLPNDYRTMVEVRNNGVPLIEHAPRASITLAMLSLSDALTSAADKPKEEVPAAVKAGWLSFLGAKKGK